MFVNDSSHSSWTKLFGKYGSVQENELRGHSEPTQYHEHSAETMNVRTIESTSPSWTKSTSSHDQVSQWTKAKVLVYSDSVLCLVKMNDSKGAIERWDGQVEEFEMSA